MQKFGYIRVYLGGEHLEAMIGYVYRALAAMSLSKDTMYNLMMTFLQASLLWHECHLEPKVDHPHH